MSGHTPGPWNVASYTDESPSLNVIAGEEKHVDGRVQAHWIAELDTVSDDDFDVVEANAHLIAAAPALLANLRVALWHLGNPDIQISEGAFDNIRAAIAKATGESA